MASLNSSTNGPSISSSYQGVISSSLSAAFNSPTYGQWALLSVSTPLVNAFRPDQGGKESILKVQSTGEGELGEMIEEFSEGRIQFAFLKIKDSNTSLPKYVLIGWCGEGVPERTKGYFTSHLAAVSSILHGYHVQITARSDRDLTPEIIIKKVADASGSKYSRSKDVTPTLNPPVASKPVFSPSQFSISSRSNVLANTRSRGRIDNDVDDDGWGADAPQVTRSQLEKVAPAYKPTKVNMAELTRQNSASSQNIAVRTNENSNIIKGGYQPVGKVDIAALRAQSQKKTDDRPTVVKGAYEPVGKVDIAAIRAKAQKPANETNSFQGLSSKSNLSDLQPYPVTLADRGAAFSQAERMTELPKTKVTNKFGTVTANFIGTKAPKPGGFGSEFTPAPFTPPTVGIASKTFADEGGKTPSQVWQEKKARERGLSGAGSNTLIRDPQNTIRTSPAGEWKSGYEGKSWASVTTNPSERTGPQDIEIQRTGDLEQGQEETVKSPLGGINIMRQQFQGGVPVNPPPTQNSPTEDQSSPPSINTLTRPTHTIPPPLPPTANSQDSDIPQREASPIRVAIPVPRIKDHESEVADGTDIPNLVQENLYRSNLDQTSVHSDNANTESARIEDGTGVVENPGLPSTGKCALIQYDYEIAEDNEIQLVEGEYVTNINMVDEDWWMGTNSKGESGLFPSNYVELLDNSPIISTAPPAVKVTYTATALYDYEAAEDNELSFEEDAVITNVEFPDDDWWHGCCNGKSGLFPANYVQLSE